LQKDKKKKKEKRRKRKKRFFSGVHACVNGADAITN
jgi:hypothetical protein